MTRLERLRAARQRLDAAIRAKARMRDPAIFLENEQFDALNEIVGDVGYHAPTDLALALEAIKHLHIALARVVDCPYGHAESAREEAREALRWLDQEGGGGG